MTLTFRYGREDEEVMGLKFCNEAIMSLAQLYPPYHSSDRQEATTPFQVGSAVASSKWTFRRRGRVYGVDEKTLTPREQGSELASVFIKARFLPLSFEPSFRWDGMSLLERVSVFTGGRESKVKLFCEPG